MRGNQGSLYHLDMATGTRGTRARRGKQHGNGQGTDRREELIEKLAAGVQELTGSDQWRDYLRVQSRFRKYSFGNTMLIMMQRPTATRVMAFGNKEGTSGWKALGRKVKQGEHAIWIWAPSRRKVTTESADGETEEQRVIASFHPVPVFDVSQTEGKPLPEVAHPLQGDDHGAIEGLSAFIQGQGWTVQFVPQITGMPGCDGTTSHRDKTIQIATHRIDEEDGNLVPHSPAHKAASLSHEWAHAELHEDTDEYVAHRGTAELEAESISFVVNESLGIPSGDFSFGYVAGWQNGDAAKAREQIKASGARIQKVSRTILDALEKRETDARAGETQRWLRHVPPTQLRCTCGRIFSGATPEEARRNFEAHDWRSCPPG